MKEILARLALILALSNDSFASLSEADQEKKVADEIKRLQAEAKKAEGIAALEAAKTTAEAALATATTEKEKLTAEAAIGAAALKALRDDVTRMYKVLNPTPDAAMLAVIEKADKAALDAFQGTYQGQMDTKFPGHCNSCQSTDVSRNSAIIEPPKEGEDGKTKAKGKAKTSAELQQELMAVPSESYEAIHGKSPKK